MARIDGATNNIGNATSFNQTQDGYLQKVNDALSRMSELSVLSQDVTKATGDRALYNQEYQALGSYVNNVATKDFNGVSLFNGTTLNVTTDSDGNTFANVGVNLGSSSYTTATSDTIDTVANSKTALTDVKAAIDQLASDRANVGANMESLGYYNDQLSSLKNNLSAANSRITDVDVAQESTNYAKYNILVQSGTAMLAQANSQPQSVLRLLQ
jgi:flagellin